MDFDSPLSWTYDGDRDCPGNPGRLFGCRCINHRPDLYNSTMTITGATLCTVAPANTNGTNILPLSTRVSGTYMVPIR